MARVASLWGPPLAWMMVLFLLSSRPTLGLAGAVPDWITHGTAYLILSGLLCRALAGGRNSVSTAGAAFAIVLATLYGISDEYHQSYVPGRTADVADVLKDAGGACLGALLYRLMVRE